MTVSPPKADELFLPAEATPRPHADLVAAVMELRSCSRPTAERYLERVGAEQCEREVQGRWLG
jgi:hypothetical protein